jgi:molecular chaperone GrpE
MSKEKEIEIKHDSPMEIKEDKPLSTVPGEEAHEEEVAREAEIRSLNEKCQELNDKFLRLYAEFDNYRKHAAREKQEILKFGSEQLVFELLTVLDTLEIALEHAGEGTDEGLKTGIEMTLKEFQRVLEKFGVKRLDAKGQPFDPAFHEAMARVENDEVDEGKIIHEFRKGYLYHDKLLRPSLVSVSKKNEKV